MSEKHSQESPEEPSVWWREPMVWLVVSGPAVVVVAGIVTAVIAVQGADTLVARDGETTFAEKPAVQGRNHAATPEPKR